MESETQKEALDWPEQYLRHLQARDGQAYSNGMADYLRGKDTFLPEAVGQFEESDLDKMLLILKEVTSSAYRVDYYVFYMQIIEKLAQLVAEKFPEKFAALDTEAKDLLFGTKMSLPDELSLYETVYAYLLNHRELPNLVFPTGLTLRDYLERLGMEKEELEDERLRELIGKANDQYAQYFEQHFSQENGLPANY